MTAWLNAALPPEDAANPREVLLARGGRILLGGAVAQGALSLVVMVVALLAGFGVLPDAFAFLKNTLLFGVAVGADVAAAMVILLAQLHMSLLLVGMVGVRAREWWAYVLLVALAFASGASLLFWGFTPSLISLIVALWCLGVMVRDRGAFRLNPVMVKELRGRMRGARAFVVLAVYLGLMSAFLALLYAVSVSQNQATGSAAAGEIGRVVFAGVVGIQLMLIIFIAPAFTSGAITGERERQTYDLLRTTLLPIPSFLIGKLESSLGYVLLLLLAAIPLQAIAFLFGGVTESELALAFVILSVTAITLGAVGIYFSSSATRTLAASIQAYTSTLVVTFIIPLLASFVVSIINFSARANKLVGLEAALTYISDFLVSLNPLATAYQTQELLVGRQAAGFWKYTLASNGSLIPRVSPWITFSIIYLVAAAVLTVLAVRRMRRMTEGE